MQTKRLSQAPPQHFAQMPKASEEEIKLAEKIQAKLAKLAGAVTPEDVVPSAAISAMLGLPIKKVLLNHNISQNSFIRKILTCRRAPWFR